jgi:Na+/proline symporter
MKDGVPVGGFDSIIPTMLSTLPDFLIAIVVILVLSASMSTLSSLVIASSSTLTIDLLKGNIIKKMSDKKQVVLIRVFVVVFIAISALIAIYQTQSQNESVKFIAQLMGVSWGALAGAFLAPFLYGLYWKKTTKLACWVSFIFGAGVMTLNLFFRSYFPQILQSPINCGAFVMLAGLIIVPVVSLISPKPKKEMVDEAFACYEKRVPAAQKRSLD